MVIKMVHKNQKKTPDFARKSLTLLPRNRSGWIEIVEAFVAVLLVAGVLLVVINKGTFGKTDISDQVYTAQLSILREIETNDAFRAEILAVSPLPALAPTDIQNRINLRAPNYLICQGQICALSDKCVFSSTVQKDIYAQEVIITSTIQTIDYRKLKLFCWTK